MNSRAGFTSSGLMGSSLPWSMRSFSAAVELVQEKARVRVRPRKRVRALRRMGELVGVFMVIIFNLLWMGVRPNALSRLRQLPLP